MSRDIVLLTGKKHSFRPALLLLHDQVIHTSEQGGGDNLYAFILNHETKSTHLDLSLLPTSENEKWHHAMETKMSTGTRMALNDGIQKK